MVLKSFIYCKTSQSLQCANIHGTSPRGGYNIFPNVYGHRTLFTEYLMGLAFHVACFGKCCSVEYIGHKLGQEWRDNEIIQKYKYQHPLSFQVHLQNWALPLGSAWESPKCLWNGSIHIKQGQLMKMIHWGKGIRSQKSKVKKCSGKRKGQKQDQRGNEIGNKKIKGQSTKGKEEQFWN